jgi:outer membrane protein assembly factor BamD (BamD/ComL family)
MSIAGILSSSLFNSNSQSVTSPQQSFQKEFQQLGQALQSGNLSAAQADFATLQQNSPTSSATSSASSGNPIAQAFSQLGKDLQSGNISAAQQDFSNIQQDTQSQSQSTQTSGHHHHHHGGGGGDSSSSQSTLAQEFSQLGQDLRAGNVSAAQRAYSAVQQSFAAFGANSTSTSAATLSSIA